MKLIGTELKNSIGDIESDIRIDATTPFQSHRDMSQWRTQTNINKSGCHFENC